MQFCPECKKLTMMYVHGLHEAFCINKKCKIRMKFETYDDCLDALSEFEVEHRKTERGSLPSKFSATSGSHLVSLEVLAKEIHEEFSRASVVHGIIDEEDYTPYDDLPHNLKEALLDVATYVDSHYMRR
jgi:hypothetical protein